MRYNVSIVVAVFLATNIAAFNALAQTSAPFNQITIATAPKNPTMAMDALNRGIQAENRKDYGDAMTNYLKAAEYGNAIAEFDVGFLYEKGLGVPSNSEEAVRWYRKSADHGFVHAQNNLGYLYASGTGVPIDYQEAMKWYLKAAAQGNARAMVNIGDLYYGGKGALLDYAQALEWYRKAAASPSKGDPAVIIAQNSIGWAYWLGRGVPRDMEQAKNWYRKSAEAGNETAQNQLGVLYAFNEPTDYAEAMKWFTLAAQHPRDGAVAQNNIGRMYEEGLGVPKNYSLALEWYKKSDAQGYSRAAYHIGYFYDLGLGATRDDKQAKAMMEKASNLGVPEAQAWIKMTPEEHTRWQKAMEIINASMHGPNDVPLIDQATLQLPLGYIFISANDAKQLEGILGKNPDFFNNMKQNIIGFILPDKKEVKGLIVVGWSNSGYVKDDKLKNLNADKMLSYLKEKYTLEKAISLPRFTIVGWNELPTYDVNKHQLIQALEIDDHLTSQKMIDYSALVLGKEGCLELMLYTRESDIQGNKEQINKIIDSVRYNTGKRYEDFIEGTDILAKMGLWFWY